MKNENEILESCLDALQQGASLADCIAAHPELDAESVMILQAASQMRTVGAQLSPTPAFKRRARRNLMQRIATEEAQAAPTLGQRWRAFWAGLSGPGLGLQPIVAMIAIIFMFALSVGVVSAAQKSKPGDLLYPVKQLTDHARSALHRQQLTTPSPIAPTSAPATRTPITVPVQNSVSPQLSPTPGITQPPAPLPSVQPTDIPAAPLPTATPIPGPTMNPTQMPSPTMPPAPTSSVVPTMAPPTATTPPTTAPTMPPSATATPTVAIPTVTAIPTTLAPPTPIIPQPTAIVPPSWP